MTHINIKISKAVATAEKDGIITTGMVGVPVSFMFDSWWDGLTVTAVFKGSGAPISVPLLGATETVVPWEVLKRPSTLLRIGAEGRLPDGTLVIPTTWATVGIVMSGANATDDLAKPPTPTAFDRIMSQIGNMNDLATEDKSSLVAAVNEAMEKGDGVDVSGASVGQIIKVAAVDDAGKPTAWEPADLPKHVQSDWDQNDESQADFVKNRPFYTGDPVETVLLEEQIVTFYNDGDDAEPYYMSNEDFSFDISAGDIAKVMWDGTEYSCIVVEFRGPVKFGNLSIDYDDNENTGEPFIFDGSSFCTKTSTDESHRIKLSKVSVEVNKIDEKYLPPISKQVVYDLNNAVFKERTGTYYFVDPTTLTEILRSINTGSIMPYIGFKSVNDFFANAGIYFGWGISMNAESVTVFGMHGNTAKINAYIFDTFEHAKEYYER